MFSQKTVTLCLILMALAQSASAMNESFRYYTIPYIPTEQNDIVVVLETRISDRVDLNNLPPAAIDGNSIQVTAALVESWCGLKSGDVITSPIRKVEFPVGRLQAGEYNFTFNATVSVKRYCDSEPWPGKTEALSYRFKVRSLEEVPAPVPQGEYDINGAGEVPVPVLQREYGLNYSGKTTGEAGPQYYTPGPAAPIANPPAAPNSDPGSVTITQSYPEYEKLNEMSEEYMKKFLKKRDSNMVDYPEVLQKPRWAPPNDGPLGDAVAYSPDNNEANGRQEFAEATERMKQIREKILKSLAGCGSGDCNTPKKITIESGNITVDGEGLTISSKDSNGLGNVKIDVSFGDSKATIEKNVQQTETRITVGEVTALTKEKIEIDDGGLKIAGQKAIVTPAMAMQKVQEGDGRQLVERISIEGNEQPTYVVESKKQAKLLWVMPVELTMKTKVDIATGEIIWQEKPWWSFLAT